MSSAENVTSAMSKSIRDNAQQVAMTEESRQLLVDLLEDRMRIAVAEGIKEAMTKDTAAEFAKVFLETVRSQATTSVDLWAGGIVRSVLKRFLVFLLAGSIVYSVGGWTALASFGKWLTGGK